MTKVQELNEYLDMEGRELLQDLLYEFENRCRIGEASEDMLRELHKPRHCDGELMTVNLYYAIYWYLVLRRFHKNIRYEHRCNLLEEALREFGHEASKHRGEEIVCNQMSDSLNKALTGREFYESFAPKDFSACFLSVLPNPWRQGRVHETIARKGGQR